ncbi:Hypothetical protein SRAE_2000305200 [Strongyloides ratti]|uniref:Uncharacterized protein n=1 Tax=Strongyloides ratti TaxID=34506 RepID=A0A090LLH5_STRRB|nr:Hypothetical protein SRAE_2000305200 [Strongyloides ratti]CEF68395.1 Hypothetical protein SRAE_2000305200 [Strongyloides ratti]
MKVKQQFFGSHKNDNLIDSLDPKSFEINSKKLSTKLFNGELSTDQSSYLIEIIQLIHKLLSPYLKKDEKNYIYDYQMERYVENFFKKLSDIGVIKRIVQEKTFLYNVNQNKKVMANYTTIYNEKMGKVKVYHNIIKKCFNQKNITKICRSKFKDIKDIYNNYLIIFKNMSKFNNINDLRNKFIDDIAFNFRKHISQIEGLGNTSLNELYTFSAFDHLEYVLKIVERDWNTIMNFYDTKIEQKELFKVEELFKLDKDILNTCYKYSLHPYSPNDIIIFKKKELKIEPTPLYNYLDKYFFKNTKNIRQN